MLIGWLIGTVCLIGLARALFWRRRGFYHHPAWAYGHGSGCGSGSPTSIWGVEPRPFEQDDNRGYGFRRAGRGVVFAILERLEATPAQEKAIRAALQDLKDSMTDLRGSLREHRRQVAGAFRGSEFDASTLTAGLGSTVTELRSDLATALETIHAVLDERQRKILADLIESA
jgi:uncharacterized membrane protein